MTKTKSYYQRLAVDLQNEVTDLRAELVEAHEHGRGLSADLDEVIAERNALSREVRTLEGRIIEGREQNRRLLERLEPRP